jgi:hypothetical protein
MRRRPRGCHGRRRCGVTRPVAALRIAIHGCRGVGPGLRPIEPHRGEFWSYGQVTCAASVLKEVPVPASKRMACARTHCVLSRRWRQAGGTRARAAARQVAAAPACGGSGPTREQHRVVALQVGLDDRRSTSADTLTVIPASAPTDPVRRRSSARSYQHRRLTGREPGVVRQQPGASVNARSFASGKYLSFQTSTDRGAG